METAPGDIFLVDVQGSRITVTHEASGACWTLSVCQSPAAEDIVQPEKTLEHSNVIPILNRMISLLWVTAVLETSLKVHDVAPDFTAQDTEGKTYTLSQLLQQGPVVLAFFPKAFTPGCTMEMRSYRDRFTEVEKLGARVLAISTDDLEAQRRFKAKLEAPFTFIPDPQGTLVKLYDVKMPLFTVAKRTTFVVGVDGRIESITTGGDAVDPSKALEACSSQ